MGTLNPTHSLTTREIAVGVCATAIPFEYSIYILWMSHANTTRTDFDSMTSTEGIGLMSQVWAMNSTRVYSCVTNFSCCGRVLKQIAEKSCCMFTHKLVWYDIVNDTIYPQCLIALILVTGILHLCVYYRTAAASR